MPQYAHTLRSRAKSLLLVRLAPVLDQQRFALGGGRGRRGGRGAAPALHLGQGLLQALQAHRLGEVVHRVELEGAHGMVGVRGDEHDGRRPGQCAQRVRQRQAVLAGHVDVEQHGIDGAAAGRLQQRQRLGGVRGLGHGVARLRLLRLAVGQQRAQARAGQGFVVHDQDVHGISSPVRTCE